MSNDCEGDIQDDDRWPETPHMNLDCSRLWQKTTDEWRRAMNGALERLAKLRRSVPQ